MWIMALTALICALCLGCAAIKLYDFFEGETLFADCLDEFRLSRAELAALDRFWMENPNRSDCVVTLTTIPSRLPHIGTTLKSLMRQSRAPARIALNLPYHSKRESADYVVPNFLLELKSVAIHRCEDMGPATKVIPTLARETAAQKIIVVDDDRIYPPNLVADLEDAAARDEHSAFGMSGWVVPADLTDRPTTIWANLKMLAPAPVRARRLIAPLAVDILQGLSGYLVRPAFFDLTRLSDYSGAPEAAFYVDDVWISGHCNVPRFVIPARRYNYQPKFRGAFYKRTSLGLINRGPGGPGGDAMRHNTLVLRHLAGRWGAGDTGQA
jgi:hypothetical protein